MTCRVNASSPPAFFQTPRLSLFGETVLAFPRKRHDPRTFRDSPGVGKAEPPEIDPFGPTGKVSACSATFSHRRASCRPGLAPPTSLSHTHSTPSLSFFFKPKSSERDPLTAVRQLLLLLKTPNTTMMTSLYAAAGLATVGSLTTSVRASAITAQVRSSPRKQLI